MLPGIPYTGVLETGFSESWKCALGSCANLFKGSLSQGFRLPVKHLSGHAKTPVSKTPVCGTP